MYAFFNHVRDIPTFWSDGVTLDMDLIAGHGLVSKLPEHVRTKTWKSILIDLLIGAVIILFLKKLKQNCIQ